MDDDYEPFENAEEVWFWFCASLQARGSGLRTRCDFVGQPRICEISDVSRIVNKMRRSGSISNRHLRVMSKWGVLHIPPYYDRRAKVSETKLWEYAMNVFEIYLKNQHIL